MSRQGYLGIDLGTSAVKVLVVDDDGVALARTSRSYPIHAPRPGWAEQSPSDWWTAVCAATREAVSTAAVPIVSVGLSGQLNGLVLLDEHDRPLANAIIWLDIRAEQQALRLAALADFTEITGNALSAICVLPKLAWLEEHQPDLLAQTKRIALAKDYILLQLTGVLATDPSDALSTAMTKIGGTTWSKELAGLAQIDTDKLPPIRSAAELAGRMTVEAAEGTGLAPETPVATGAGDVAALAVGCGVVGEGRIAITLGTAGHVVAQSTEQRLTDASGLWQIPHAIAGQQLWLGLIMSGGLSLSWLRSALAHAEAPDFPKLDALAAPVPAGCEGATFLPFLEGASTPYNRPDARGAFFGLSSAHGTGHLIRAVMEGVAFNARQCVEALEAAGANSQEIRLAEGGAQSPIWCQILADTLAQPVWRIAERDTSAGGAAILGRSAAMGTAVDDIARSIVAVEWVFEPDPHRVEMLTASYERYKDFCASVMSNLNSQNVSL